MCIRDRYKEDKQGEMLYVYPECLKEERQDLIYHGVAGKSGKDVYKRQRQTRQLESSVEMVC